MVTHISARRFGRTFTVRLQTVGSYTFELVQMETPMGMTTLSDVDFPTSRLGSASRDGYARSVLESAAYAWSTQQKRDHEESV